jgi:hypothetical protein
MFNLGLFIHISVNSGFPHFAMGPKELPKDKAAAASPGALGTAKMDMFDMI